MLYKISTDTIICVMFFSTKWFISNSNLMCSAISVKIRLSPRPAIYSFAQFLADALLMKIPKNILTKIMFCDEISVDIKLIKTKAYSIRPVILP